MPEIIRTRERYRDDYSSDDERSSSHRGSRSGTGYKTIKTYRVTPNRSLILEDNEDDRRSSRSDRLEVADRSRLLEVDRRVERVDRIERPRSAMDYRDADRTRDSTRTLYYERDEQDRVVDRTREPLSPRGGERDRGERDRGGERERETRERDTEVRIERRRQERDEIPVGYERVSRKTEYYAPPEPQTVIVEAPVAAAGYEMVRRQEIIDNRQVAAPRQEEEDFYYRRDVVRAEPRRNEVARRERRRSVSEDDESSEEVIVRKERKVIRERSHSPRHKLHLAEGALAGGAAAAMIANNRDRDGHGEHRGRKVAGGAVLGALGAELVSRARSQYRDSSRNRSRSRSSSRGHDGHTKLKTGLALAATALAAAAAGKYISSRNDRKEEIARGRSHTRSRSRRRRYSTDDESVNKHAEPKHRAANMAKAGAAAAAAAGLVEHFRSKSRGRSKSRLRTGGVIAATGVAGAALAGVIESRKAKKDAALAEENRGRGRGPRSHSRTRSLDYSDDDVDPERGMVEYGTKPVHTRNAHYDDPAEIEARRDREIRASQSRSRSRVRDIASSALATGAAAIGINQYQKRRERKEAERAERERRRHEEAPRDNYYAHDSYDDGYSPSPPRGSGGYVYPENTGVPPPPVPPTGYAQPPAGTLPGPAYDAAHPPYDPAHSQYDPAHQPPHNGAEYREPPVAAPTPNPYYNSREVRDPGNVSAITPFAPLARTPVPRSMYDMADEEGSIVLQSPSSISSGVLSPILDPEPPHNKSVTFAPLSPTSTRTLQVSKRHRRNSDPSADRPNVPSHHRRRHRNPSRSPSPTSPDDVEVLPDRFDRDGRPVNESRKAVPKEMEMVERIFHDFEGVIEGHRSWRSLLRGFFEEADGRTGGGGGRRR